MMINKNTVTLCAVVAIAIMLVGLNSAFKPSKTSKKVFTVQQWFAITPTADTDPTKQLITGTISTPPVNSSTDCAQLGNFGNYCGVLLSFPSSVPSLNGKTVQQAITQNNATIVTGSGSVGYSRLP